MKGIGLLTLFQGFLCLLFSLPTILLALSGNFQIPEIVAAHYKFALPAIFVIGCVNIATGILLIRKKIIQLYVFYGFFLVNLLSIIVVMTMSPNMFFSSAYGFYNFVLFLTPFALLTWSIIHQIGLMKIIGLLISSQGLLCLLFSLPTIYMFLSGNIQIHMNVIAYYMYGLPAVFIIGCINLVVGILLICYGNAGTFLVVLFFLANLLANIVAIGASGNIIMGTVHNFFYYMLFVAPCFLLTGAKIYHVFLNKRIERQVQTTTEASVNSK
jgi:hypothetical protein